MVNSEISKDNSAGSQIRAEMLHASLLSIDDSSKRLKLDLNNEDLSTYELAGSTLNRIILQDPMFDTLPEVQARLGMLIQYLEEGMNHDSGHLIVSAYKRIRTNNSDQRFHAACLVAWCYELLKTVWTLMENSLKDHDERPPSDKREWHSVEGITRTMNDAFFLESAIWRVFWEFFPGEPTYSKLAKLFHEATRSYFMNGSPVEAVADQGLTKIDMIKEYDDTNQCHKMLEEPKYRYPLQIALILAGEETMETRELPKSPSCEAIC